MNAMNAMNAMNEGRCPMGSGRGATARWALAACILIAGLTIAPATAAPASVPTATLTPTSTLTLGDLRVQVTGVPHATPATIAVIQGRTVKASLRATSTTPATRVNQAPGTYIVRAYPITVAKGRLVPTPSTRTVTIRAKAQTTASFAYRFVGEPVTVAAATNGRTGWAKVNSTASFALKVTNASAKRNLGAFTIIVPPGVGSPTFAITSVAAPTARGSWRADVSSCRGLPSCSRLITVHPTTTSSAQLLRRTEAVSLSMRLTAAPTVGPQTFRLGTIGAGYFTVSGREAAMRVVNGVTVTGTPNTPIATATTTVPVKNSATVISADLPQGSYGPVSVYYEPAACAAGQAGQAGSCVTATVDGVFSDPKNPSSHLYGFGIAPDLLPPASLTVTCSATACPPVPTVTQVAAGFSHTCLLLTNGTVQCFGSNQYGQLGAPVGFGASTPNSTPVTVAGLPSINAIFAGYDHTCAQATNGTLWCWGRNDLGQLGTGTVSRYQPVAVPGITTALPFGAGGRGHTCVVWSDTANQSNALSCWGLNDAGQVGISGANVVTSPQRVSGLGGIPVRVTAGGYHTCAQVTMTGGDQVACWGRNDVGQTGDTASAGSVGVANSIPLVVPLQASTVLTLDAGDDFTCAVLGDSSAWCWGNDASGQLGTPLQTAATWTASPLPVLTNQTGTLQGVTMLAAGGAQTCALSSSPAVWCWGADSYGEAGVGPASPSVTAATPIGIPIGTTELSAGGAHTCAARSGKAPVCWGSNANGQLGRSTNSGTSTPNPTPDAVTGFVDDPRLADFAAYPMQVSLKVNGVYQAYGTAGMCSPASMLDSLAGQGVIAGTVNQTRRYCYDVGPSVRNPDSGELTRVILFAEDPKFTPISR